VEKKLSEMDYKDRGMVKRIDDDIKSRVASLGIRENKEIRMMTKQPIKGPVTVDIGGVTTSLGLGLADKISVVEINSWKKVFLLGQPNVGKSVVFNHLAGAGTTVSNYPGTTVDFDKGHMMLNGERVEVIDVPGTFSLEPRDRAEEVAVKMLEDAKEAIVVCVIDCCKVERGLHLALQAIEKGYSVVVDLNMADVAREANINVGAERLEEILGVPVVVTAAKKGEGLKELVSRMREAKPVGIQDVRKRLGNNQWN